MKLPLYAKIALMLFANLAFLAVASLILLKVQLNYGLDFLLTGGTGERIKDFSDVVASRLRETPREDWDTVLTPFEEAYNVELFVFRDHEEQLAGSEVSLPEAVTSHIRRRRPPRRPSQDPQRLEERRSEREAGLIREVRSANKDRDRARDASRLRSVSSAPIFLEQTKDPASYWLGVRMLVGSRERGRFPTAYLVIRSSSLFNKSLFLDVKPWIITGIAVVALCVLFWWPFVHGMTRYLRQMTQATESIATGSFGAHVSEKRSDELGRLGKAINRMADRLSGFVTGQKRFLGDTAHELCSPVARMEVALSLLERKAHEDQKENLQDVREEAEHMSEILNELLAFSKASTLTPSSINLKPVAIREMLDRVLSREASNDANIELHIAENLTAMAEDGLLTRAVANVVRNAIRYAGSAGPIIITGESEGSSVFLTISDAGPGVSEDVIDKLFDPFYRPEASRSLEFGGTGLGLAIVKSGIETCQGKVTCRNRPEGGFEVAIQLPAAGSFPSALKDPSGES